MPNRLIGMPNTDLPASLDDLTVFLAVLDAGGFRDAARRLRLAPSTVSDTVSRLETRLGVALLLRSTRSLHPTEAGRVLAETARPLIAGLDEAMATALGTAGSLRGTLRLNVPGAVMLDILPPLVEAFLARHPEVRVDIAVEDSLVDALAQGCDAGIRYGEHLAQDMIAVPLGPRRQHFAIAAAPSYAERYGLPATPAELLAHVAIRLRFAGTQPFAWELERAGEVLRVDPPARLTLDAQAFPAALSAARAGLGLIGSFGNWLDPDLRAGTLVPVLRDWWPEFEGPWLYFHRRDTVPAPLRAFLDFLAETRRHP